MIENNDLFQHELDLEFWNMKELIDTQILSYEYKKKHEFDIRGKVLPSIVAHEFLLFQSPKFTEAAFYLPVLVPIEDQQDFLKRDHPYPKRLTDSLLFDFGQTHPPFQVFSNLAISEAINLQREDLFNSAVQFQEKQRQKELRKRFRFILDNKLTCEPVVADEIQNGYILLSQFISKYKIKNNFRNSWNDILILSKAISSGMTLHTKDSLLNTFAAEVNHAQLEKKANMLILKFSDSAQPKVKNSKESKGYINNSWRFKINNHY